MADTKNAKSEPLITSEEIENIIKELEKKEQIKESLGAMKEQPPLEPPPQLSPSPPPPPPPTPTPSPVMPSPPQPPVVSPFTPSVSKPPSPPPTQPTAPPPQNQERKQPSWFLVFIKYFILFVFLFLLSYVGLNFLSYKDLASYYYKTKIQKQPPKTALSVTLPIIPETSEINLADSIIIPKINVSAPISWEVETDKEIETLKKGVVHFKGTALPNEPGTMALTGHSSSYPWAKGSYDQVFTLIYTLQPQDEILIIYQKKKYLYKVSNKKIISPKDLQVLSTSEQNLNLITCWPIGTSLKRIVIGAQLVESPKKPTDLFLPSGL